MFTRRKKEQDRTKRAFSRTKNVYFFLIKLFYKMKNKEGGKMKPLKAPKRDAPPEETEEDIVAKRILNEKQKELKKAQEELRNKNKKK